MCSRGLCDAASSPLTRCRCYTGYSGDVSPGCSVTYCTVYTVCSIIAHKEQEDGLFICLLQRCCFIMTFRRSSRNKLHQIRRACAPCARFEFPLRRCCSASPAKPWAGATSRERSRARSSTDQRSCYFACRRCRSWRRHKHRVRAAVLGSATILQNTSAQRMPVYIYPAM